MLLSYAGIAATMPWVVNCDGTVAGERYSIITIIYAKHFDRYWCYI